MARYPIELIFTRQLASQLATPVFLVDLQGLEFFAPLFDPEVEVHVWGPGTPAQPLRQRLMRYLSPPLFPVHLRDVPNLVLHDLAGGTFRVGPFQVTAEMLCHPASAARPSFRVTPGTEGASFVVP
ncbi:MAG TPA: hypothetical protein VNO26_15450 [Candidatus Limnocylindria bacterium]|nr:hypothetical protein [Candidatus Limnocylindria bacterium]